MLDLGNKVDEFLLGFEMLVVAASKWWELIMIKPYHKAMIDVWHRNLFSTMNWGVRE